MKNQSKNYMLIFIYIITYILVVAIFNPIIMKFYPNADIPYSHDNIYRGAILSLLINIPIFIIFLIILRRHFVIFFKDFKQNTKKYFTIITFAYISIFWLNLFSSLLLDRLGYSNSAKNQLFIEEMFKTSTVVIIISLTLTSIFAPLIEEVLFRKSICDAITNITNKNSDNENNIDNLSSFNTIIIKTLAVIISSFLFGYFHVINDDFIQILPYFLMGCVLGTSYYLSNRNLLVSIGIHFVNNFIASILLLIFYQ